MKMDHSHWSSIIYRNL